MIQALPDHAPEAPSLSPSELAPLTVSEIASWLVGHTLDEVERELILHTLENCGGDRVLAASVLGLSLPGLRRKMTAYAVRGQALPEPAEAAPAARESTKENTGEVPAKEVRAAAQVPEPHNDREPAPLAIVRKPEKPKTNSRLLIGGAITFAVIALIGLRVTGGAERSGELALAERPRIEVSVVEQPLPFDARIAVPVWNGPMPQIVDIAADKRIESAAKAAAMATIRAVVNFDSEQDTIMESAAEIAERALPANGALASSDISQDTRMEAAAASRPVIDWSAIDISQDTRMDPVGGPETTGSIDAETPFTAPEDVPDPLVRPAPVKRAKAATPVQRRAARPAPAQASTSAQTGPQFFPFNLFSNSSAARAADNTPAVPAACCGVN